MGFFLILYFIHTLICAYGGYAIGKERRVGETGGLLIGLFFGVIGIIILLLLPKNYDQYDEQNRNSYQPTYNPMHNEKTIKTNSADELIKWYELKEKGVITAEEFEMKKRELM